MEGPKGSEDRSPIMDEGRVEKGPSAAESGSADLDGTSTLAVGAQLVPLKDLKDGYVVLGRSSSSHSKWGRKGLLEVGAVGEHQAVGEDLFGRKVMIDAAFPHIIFICGKRGSGKSYTLGILAEELVRSAIGVGVVLIDPIGIFWSLKRENGSDTEREALTRWGLRPQSFPEVRVLLPYGSQIEGEGSSDGPFTIGVGEMTVDDWCQVFEVERFKTQGLMIGTIIEQVSNGYDSVNEGRILHIEGREDRYSIADIIQCIDSSLLINSKTSGFSPQTRRSISARFMAAAGWGIFDVDGTPLKDLSSPNRITVLDVSDPNLGDSKRSLITGIVARKVLSARIKAARLEEKGGADETDPDLIPVTWLLIDEAHIILPHGKQTTATDALIEYAKQGRKPGCALILATQRPASTSDEILSQVDILIGHNLALEDDMTALRRRVPSKLPMEFANSDFIRAIPVGTGIVADQRTQQRAFLMKVRPRLSHHAGSSAMPKAFMEPKGFQGPLPLSSISERRAPPGMMVGPSLSKAGCATMAAKSKGGEKDLHKPRPRWKAAPSPAVKLGPGPDLSTCTEGKVLVVLEEDLNKVILALSRTKREGMLVSFTRDHPDRLSFPPELGDVRHFWLSSSPGPGTVAPTDLQSISMEVQSLLQDRPRSTVLIQGIDLLLMNNGAQPVQRLVQVLHEKAVIGGHSLLLAIAPGSANEVLGSLGNEVDGIIGKAPEKDRNESERPSGPVGSLNRDELSWMCRILGLPSEGTEDELLQRIGSFRGKMGSTPPDIATKDDERLRQALDEARGAIRESGEVRKAVKDLENRATFKGDEDKEYRGPTKKKRVPKAGNRLVLVWDQGREEGRKEAVEAFIGEINGIRQRANVPLLKGAVTGQGDPLLYEILDRMDRERREDLKRLDDLEKALKKEISGLRPSMEGDHPSTSAKVGGGTEQKVPSKLAGDRTKKGPKLKKAKTLKALPEAIIVKPEVPLKRAMEAAKGSLRRSFFKGPRERIEEIEPVFTPLYRYRVRYKGWLPGSTKEGDILLDGLLGEIVLPSSSGLRRSSGLTRLIAMTDKEAALMASLRRSPKDDERISKESSLTLRDTRRLLTSLSKKGLVRRTAQEGRIYVYSLPEGIELPDKPWSSDTGLRPDRAEVEETVLSPFYSKDDADKAVDLMLRGARRIESDIIHYPYFAARATGEGRERYIAVDGRTGKVDQEMSGIIGKAIRSAHGH